jgi:acyl-CoA synthetase (NDP forming)
LAGNYKIIEALSKQLGLITVDDFKEMLDVAKLLLSQPHPKGNRMGVISISGAGTVLSCDLGERYNLSLPSLTKEQYDSLIELFPKFAWDDVSNPLDIWSAVEYVGPEEAYLSAGEIFLKQGGRFDMLLYLLTGIKETEFDWKKLHDLNTQYEMPIYMGLFGGDKKLILKWREILEETYNIPVFQSMTTLMKSLSKATALNPKSI